MSSINDIIKAPIANVFRRVSIKRRVLGTGLFESDWLDITGDVKTFGKIVSQIDSGRRNKFTFSNAKIVVQNDKGKYHPHDSPSSLWFGFLNQQRTLVKIDIGFLKAVRNSSGIWIRNEFPSESQWDEAFWDTEAAIWDAEQSSTVFRGVISGDIPMSDKNEVALNIKPLISVFQDFPAKNLTGFTSTGLTASEFVEMVRDQTDGAGNFIFRPFFGDTTANWNIVATSNTLSNLNTSTAKDVIDRTVWEVIEKLAEAENYVPYVDRDGVFNFVPRTSVDTATSFQFHGSGSFNSKYGHTIKSVNSYGFRISKYYSRVQIKFVDEDTSTSYEIVEASLTVSGDSNPWVLGARTFGIENFYIPNSATANTLAQEIFNDVSSLKREIEFTTSLVPHLDIFDRFSIFYDPSDVDPQSLWDQNSWAADDTNTSEDLIFDKYDGQSIVLNGQEFKFLSFEIDLDNLENKFLAREV